MIIPNTQLKLRLITVAICFGLLSANSSSHAQSNYQHSFEQGKKYYLGNSVEQNYPSAFIHLGDAARGGHAEAQFYLGLMFNHGYGTDQSYDRARHWFEIAANAGVPGAHHALGNLFHHGFGVAQNHMQAVYWYQRALEYGYEESIDPLAELYLNGSVASNKIISSKSLVKQIAASGDVTAQYNLAYMHYIGHNVPQDHKLAASWFLKAAMQGDADSQYHLGKMYRAGEGLKVNFGRCYVWSSLAAHNEHEEAAAIQGECKAKLSNKEISKLDVEIDDSISALKAAET